MSGTTTRLGCIGKCTSGLSLEELDAITDSVHRTLVSSKGRRIFRRYLEQGRRSTDLECLDLYERIGQYVDNDRARSTSPSSTGSSSVEALAADAQLALESLDELDGVREIDLALLERFTQALDSQSRPALLAVLEETNNRLSSHLANAHKGFRAYAKQPCPKG